MYILFDTHMAPLGLFMFDAKCYSLYINFDFFM